MAIFSILHQNIGALILTKLFMIWHFLLQKTTEYIPIQTT